MKLEIIQYAVLAAAVLPLSATLLGSLLSSANLRIRILLAAHASSFILAAAGLGAQTVSPELHCLTAVPGIFELRCDFVSTLLVTGITYIASIVLFFSDRYLSACAIRESFIRLTSLLASAAIWLALSGSLLSCLLFWHLQSWLLWRLLCLKTDAKSSAAKTILLHHFCSDLFLAAAAILVFHFSHSSSFNFNANVLASLQQNLNLPATALSIKASELCSLFIIIAMSIKSAIFPFHRWLLATLEAPTPLSGLLHAGVVNVSALLAARVFPLLNDSPSLLIAWGALAFLSAVVGTISMSAQPDVKRKLVFSTVGQMGFMCLQCASGAIPAALFHMLAHGLFKCQMFLQSGSTVAEGTMKRDWLGTQAPLKLPLALKVITISTVALAGTLIFLKNSEAETLLVASALLASLGILGSLPSMRRINTLGLVTIVSLVSIACGFSFVAISMIGHYVPAQVASQSSFLLPLALLSFGIGASILHGLSNCKFGDWLYVQALNGFSFPLSIEEP